MCKANVRKTRLVVIIFLLLFFPWIASGASLYWDAAGKANSLGNLDLSVTDSVSTSGYSTGEHYSNDGFLGRFVYTGPADELIFSNIGPTSSGGSSNFYYTKTNSTTRWRRFFFVATIIARDHNNTRINISATSPNTNTIIENVNDKIILDVGAGTEEYVTSDPSYTGGYNSQGTFGTGAAFKYVYPYKYYWMDITVIRLSNANRLNNGTYESLVSITGSGVSMALSLGGYYGSSGPNSFSFSVDRVCPDIIPFEELLEKKTQANNYLVGYLKYQSVDTRVKVKLASNIDGNQINFRFQSGTDYFDYYVGFKSNTPSGNLTYIQNTNTTFSSTANPVAVTSPVENETQNQYVLNGEIRIWVGADLTIFSKPPKTYTSKIYCILTAY